MDQISRFKQIMYPAGAANICSSRGRNGYIKTAGVEVYDSESGGFVQLSPVNSKGTVSDTASVQVPRDRATLLVLADHLVEIANRL